MQPLRPLTTTSARQWKAVVSMSFPFAVHGVPGHFDHNSGGPLNVFNDRLADIAANKNLYLLALFSSE